MITQTGRIRALRGFSKIKHLWKPFFCGTKWWKWKFPVLFQHLNSISKLPGAQEGISLGLRCCFLPLPSLSGYFFHVFYFRKIEPPCERWFRFYFLYFFKIHLTKSTASNWLNDRKLCRLCASQHKWQTELIHPLFLLLSIQFFSAHPNWPPHWKDHSLEYLNNHVSSLFSPQVFLCVLCLLAAMLPPASCCPSPCLCYSDGLVDCGGRGLSSLPPLHLLPPGSRSLLLANNKLASLGASAFANLSSLEVCGPLLNAVVKVLNLLCVLLCAVQGAV